MKNGELVFENGAYLHENDIQPQKWRLSHMKDVIPSFCCYGMKIACISLEMPM